MKQTLIKRIISCALVSLMFGACLSNDALAAWDVTPSKVDYYVEFDDSLDIFICNQKTIGTKVGTEYYLTYTVDSIEAEQVYQTGVIGTNVPTQVYPYVESEAGGGIYKYSTSNKLLIEGYTYFLKFTITEDGYKYRVAWAEDDENKSKYIEFDQTYGEVKTNLGYFGAFLGASDMKGKLTKVRCYDKNGNDLGVQVTPGRNGVVGLEQADTSGINVEHSYDITLTACPKIAISNKRVATGDKIYMEYTVKSSDSKVYQSGLVTSDAPQAGYPYLDGYMVFDQYELDAIPQNGPLLEPGAKYFIGFEKKADSFEVTVQKTTNGKTTLVSFQKVYGTYKENYNFRSIWLCGMAEQDILLNAVLTGFKCYDSNGNNLGVQVNDTSNCEIVHYGEREDYAGCEAMYYCDEDASLYALYENKTLKYTENKNTQDGTYRIDEYVMTAQIGDANREYDYLYQYFTDDEERVYRRLHSCQLIFETGDGSEVETQVLNADNGYMPMRPEEPTLEGKAFQGWYTSEGEEFDFQQLVTESQTVYAKWDKVTYTSMEGDGDFSPSKVVSVVATVMILGIAITCGTVIVVRGKRNESKKEANK